MMSKINYIICTASTFSWWTVGKVYPIDDDGSICADDGDDSYEAITLLTSTMYIGQREFKVYNPRPRYFNKESKDVA